jgi:hypothetical protein
MRLWTLITTAPVVVMTLVALALDLGLNDVIQAASFSVALGPLMVLGS